jgi:hypothetical protein
VPAKLSGTRAVPALKLFMRVISAYLQTFIILLRSAPRKENYSEPAPKLAIHLKYTYTHISSSGAGLAYCYLLGAGYTIYI